WFQGEFCGAAIADVLFGDYNPSGKLPITFPKTVGQLPYNFPFKRGSQPPTESLNAQEKKTLVNGALYPFGFGLSYTTYQYSNLSVSPTTIALDVQNTGARAGDEIVQLYLSPRVTSIVYYDKVLRGFDRVALQPGEKKRIRFAIGRDDLLLLDRDMKWTVEPGTYDVMIGASSEDIRLRGTFDIKQTRIPRCHRVVTCRAGLEARNTTCKTGSHESRHAARRLRRHPARDGRLRRQQHLQPPAVRTSRRQVVRRRPLAAPRARRIVRRHSRHGAASHELERDLAVRDAEHHARQEPRT